MGSQYALSGKKELCESFTDDPGLLSVSSLFFSRFNVYVRFAKRSLDIVTISDVVFVFRPCQDGLSNETSLTLFRL